MSLVRGARDSLGSAERVGEIQIMFDIIERSDRGGGRPHSVPESLTHISVCPDLKVRPPKCDLAKGIVWDFISQPPP